MTAITDINGSADPRATRRQVLEFIAHSDLPVPQKTSVHDNGVIFLDFDAYDELNGWADHLRAERGTDREEREDGARLFSYFTFGNLLGYHGVLTCHEDAPAAVDCPEHGVKAFVRAAEHGEAAAA